MTVSVKTMGGGDLSYTLDSAASADELISKLEAPCIFSFRVVRLISTCETDRVESQVGMRGSQFTILAGILLFEGEPALTMCQVYEFVVQSAFHFLSS